MIRNLFGTDPLSADTVRCNARLTFAENYAIAALILEKGDVV